MQPAARGRGIAGPLAALLAGGTTLAGLPAHAAARFCDRAAEVGAAEQDRLLQFAAVAKRLLDASGRQVALVSRSGLDLARFGIRYSHAGITLAANPNGAWSVRQLYYACDESRPRLFDQGVAGFVFGTDDARSGYLSLVLLPGTAGAALEQTALDRRRALALLGADYSANAHAWSTRYQNCNQWVAELLALAWAAPDAAGAGTSRVQAQRWLRSSGYEPATIELGSHALLFAAHFVPLIHVADHPLAELQALTMRVSMPAAIEAYARRHEPRAERIELCHDERHIVVRRGWQPLADGCEPAPGDEVLPFER